MPFSIFHLSIKKKEMPSLCTKYAGPATYVWSEFQQVAVSNMLCPSWNITLGLCLCPNIIDLIWCAGQIIKIIIIIDVQGKAQIVLKMPDANSTLNLQVSLCKLLRDQLRH